MLYFTAGSTRVVRANRRASDALIGRMLDTECREIRADLARAGLM